jgi:uncharacterized LabA/DUF88 family protein
MTPLRAIVFIDGQNLYHSPRSAWASVPQTPGSPYGWPSYDVEKLATWLATRMAGRALEQIRFYTGLPDPNRGASEAFWHGFWSNKLRYLASRVAHVTPGRVNPGGQEKGVDVSLAIDLIQLTYEQRYDVAILVTRDWDFGPAVRLAKTIARTQHRQLSFESAFPATAGSISRPRGVPGTTWVVIDKGTYDACHDPADYRPAL